MAVMGYMKQQVDDLGALRELIDLVKNPKAIVEAHELARSQIALTEDMQKQADAANSAISKHEKLAAELQAERDAINADKAAHANVIAEFEAYKNGEKERLAQLAADLNEKARIQSEESKRIAAEAKATQDALADIERQKASLQDSITAKVNDLAKQSEANASEANRLALFESEMKAKAEKLRAASAEF